MPSAIKSLADGELQTSDGVLYKCPSGASTSVDNMVFINTTVATRTLNLFKKKPNRTARRLVPEDFQLPPGYRIDFGDEQFQMSSLDEIRGSADTLGVDFIIDGRELT